MSISSTGLYGSATIVNTDIFDDTFVFVCVILCMYVHRYAPFDYIMYICI
jgi:hypothetical protein